MRRVVDFERRHLAEIIPQPSQSLTDVSGDWADPDLAVTLMDGDRIEACGGFIRERGNRFTAWALLSDRVSASAVYRAARLALDRSNLRRVEATVSANSPKAIRFVEALGFRFEGTMIAYAPNGDTHNLYARVAEWTQ